MLYILATIKKLFSSIIALKEKYGLIIKVGSRPLFPVWDKRDIERSRRFFLPVIHPNRYAA